MCMGENKLIIAAVFLALTLSVFLAGCGAEANGKTVSIRTGKIDTRSFDDNACNAGWRCDGDERYFLTSDCEKQEIHICREGCSVIDEGECVPTEDSVVKEIYRVSDNSGRIKDIKRIRIEGTSTRIELKRGDIIQAYFSEDDWYMIKAGDVSYKNKQADFYIDDLHLAPLKKGGITHAKTIFIRVVEIKPGPATSMQDTVVFDLGKTPK